MKKLHLSCRIFLVVIAWQRQLNSWQQLEQRPRCWKLEPSNALGGYRLYLPPNLQAACPVVVRGLLAIQAGLAALQAAHHLGTKIKKENK